MKLFEFVTSHPVIASFAALFVLSSLVDAMKRIAPAPTQKGFYAFVWVLCDSLAGNLITALMYFLKVFFPKDEKVFEELASGNSAVADNSSGAVSHNSDNRQQ